MPTTNKRDERIQKALRASIAADLMLSPEAKQVEVIVKDRKVILKGQAHSEGERMDIDTKARATDDVIDVDDQIQLVP
jgi:osmotically-inducible protein OsmY